MEARFTSRLHLCEQLQHESSEKDKYRSLLRELLEAQRNRRSERLSKEQLLCWKRCGRPTVQNRKKTPRQPQSGTG
jgi:hypothetical protein